MTVEELRALLHYEPETGTFTWRVKPSRRVAAGAIAGALRKKDGYMTVTISKVPHYAHRLAWFYMTGAWPLVEIDHRNTVRSDNRFANLREASDFPNQQNVRKATRRSRLGVLGVSRSGRGYRAIVRTKGKNHYSTTFLTTDEAYDEYVNMKRTLHLGGTL
jgi:hypothetical protein